MVDNVGGVPGIGGDAPLKKLQAHAVPETRRGEDAVEISAEVMKLKETEGIRLDKVMEVRREIANRTFLTPDKLDQALDKAIDEALEIEPKSDV